MAQFRSLDSYAQDLLEVNLLQQGLPYGAISHEIYLQCDYCYPISDTILTNPITGKVNMVSIWILYYLSLLIS